MHNNEAIVASFGGQILGNAESVRLTHQIPLIQIRFPILDMSVIPIECRHRINHFLFALKNINENEILSVLYKNALETKYFSVELEVSKDGGYAINGAPYLFNDIKHLMYDVRAIFFSEDSANLDEMIGIVKNVGISEVNDFLDGQQASINKINQTFVFAAEKNGKRLFKNWKQVINNTCHVSGLEFELDVSKSLRRDDDFACPFMTFSFIMTCFLKFMLAKNIASMLEPKESA